MIEFLNFYFLPGLVLGSIYALGAVGVSLLFGILRFAHFAHGDLMSVGAYIAFSMVTVFNMTPYAAIPFSIVGVSLLALLIDRICYKPFRQSKTVILVISSLGVSLMMRSLIQLIWGVNLEVYSTGIKTALNVSKYFRISEHHIWIILGAFVLIFLTHLFLKKTKLGKSMRAMSDDQELALVSGIHTEKVIMATWIIGGSLTAVAGVFLGIDTQLSPRMGWDQLLPLFAAAILGGIGRPYGAIAGAMVIGMAEEISSYPFLGPEPLLSPAYKTGVAFFIMVLMLIWRPTGLFKGRSF
jgi:branched-subunit amino acid ABC-type transport system permease component